MAGNKLFGVDIAGLIRANTRGQLLVATLTKVVAGVRTTANPTSGTNPTETAYAAEGFIDSMNRKDLAGTLVEAGDIIVILIGNSIAVEPEIGDKVTIESKTYNIRALDRDPAKATYTLLAKAV